MRFIFCLVYVICNFKMKKRVIQKVFVLLIFGLDINLSKNKGNKIKQTVTMSVERNEVEFIFANVIFMKRLIRRFSVLCFNSKSETHTFRLNSSGSRIL